MEQILQTPSDIFEKVKQPSFRIVGAESHGFKKGSVPDLPKVKTAPVSNHQHRANPHFVLDLLQDLELHAQEWVGKLQQVQRDIQNLYLEGPLINGWLESAATGKQLEGKLLITPAELEGGYCLCGLDEYGRLWSKPCPVNELPAVGVAIARYHRLKKLLDRKSEIEQQLQGFVKSLERVYDEAKLTTLTESTGQPLKGSAQ